MFTADRPRCYETKLQGQTVVKSIRHDDVDDDSAANLELRKRRFHSAYRAAMRHLGRHQSGVFAAMFSLFSGLGYNSPADRARADRRLQNEQARDVWESLNRFVSTTGKY
jgi:hypothetical protein